MAIRVAWALATLLGVASPTLAGECRLALVLAIDVSESVDYLEDRFQRQGLARALVSPEVVRAFFTGEPVALYVFEWSGSSYQVTFAPGWQLVRTEEDLLRMAAAIAASTRDQQDQLHQRTALGRALGYAAMALEAGPSCSVRTVDIVGDGRSNSGPGPRSVYASGTLDGVTVNALIVDQGSDDPVLLSWFERAVLHGPGAFWMLADGYEDYERAMRGKLVRELQAPMVSGWPAHGRQGPLG